MRSSLSPRHQRARRLIGLTALLTFPLGCSSLVFYDVTRVPVDDCDITPAGEFCGDLGAPVTEKYAVELVDGTTVIYIGDEVWVDDVVEGERNIIKEEQVTKEPGPCTSTHRRQLRFVFENEGRADQRISGSFEESTRVEGPDACGDTPRGTRKLFQITGTQSTSF